jgi:DNA-binding XRE family transcriptional regulator
MLLAIYRLRVGSRLFRWDKRLSRAGRALRLKASADLRALRHEGGYSQDSFAHRTGYHRNYIGQLERGEKSPSLTALFDFAKTFGMRPSEVLKCVEGHLSREH